VAQAIIGLGNPGPEYRDTRHNMGARVLDALARKLKVRFQRSGGHLVGQTKWRGQVIYLIKPQCFMNVMGPPVARATRKLKLVPGELVFVYDDLDLPLGKVRVRNCGSLTLLLSADCIPRKMPSHRRWLDRGTRAKGSRQT
jgi:PTH1 family peptidyl-tRNA hydrolase